MAKVKPLDIARQTRELSPATKEDVAQGLGVDAESGRFKKVFANAAERGLVEQAAPGTERDGTRWALSKKGKRRLAAQASE
jgi:hypothetical protein